MKYVVVDFESFYSQEYSLRRMTPVEYILDPRWEAIGVAVKDGNKSAEWIDAPHVQGYFDALDPQRHVPHRT